MLTIGNSPVSWMETLQHTVTLSITEAKYMALGETIKEEIWLKGLIRNLGFLEEKTYFL